MAINTYLVITSDVHDIASSMFIFFPGLYFLARWRYAKNLPEKKWKMILQESFFAGCIAFVIAFLYLLLMIVVSTTDVKSVYLYKSIMNQYDDPRLEHFPEKIPKNSTEKKFFARYGFLQGGTVIQLKYKLPPEEINELLDIYRAEAKYTLYGGETWRGWNELYEIHSTYYYTNDVEDDYVFPDTFEILVFDAQPYKPKPEDKVWNHGTTYGVAIDEENSIIVYWLEDW